MAEIDQGGEAQKTDKPAATVKPEANATEKSSEAATATSDGQLTDQELEGVAGGTQYTLTVKNESTAFENFAVYQNDPH